MRFRNKAIKNSFENLIRPPRVILPVRAGDRQKRWLLRTARRCWHAQIPLAAIVSTTFRWQARRDDGEHSGR
jgi:hypothetical protein